jgi:fructan beta-fructosidase
MCFGNEGEKVISTMIYPDTDATGMSVFADGKAMLKSFEDMGYEQKVTL